jgi:hypothetical protein
MVNALGTPQIEAVETCESRSKYIGSCFLCGFGVFRNKNPFF